jgi:hypothetical protein
MRCHQRGMQGRAEPFKARARLRGLQRIRAASLIPLSPPAARGALIGKTPLFPTGGFCLSWAAFPCSPARASIPGVWTTLQTLWERLLEPRPLVGAFSIRLRSKNDVSGTMPSVLRLRPHNLGTIGAPEARCPLSSLLCVDCNEPD